MALTETQQTKASVKINHVPTDADVQTLFNNGSFNPGEIIVTPDEDENLACLRTEIVYDMSSSDANKNWGYVSGIGTGKVISGKDFSRYDKLIIHATFENTISGTGILDLSHKISGTGTYRTKLIFGPASANHVYYYCFVRVDGNKTEFANGEMGYSSTSETGQLSSTSTFISKIEGVFKSPAMIYTGAELNEGDGISINNGVISSNSTVVKICDASGSNASKALSDSLSNYKLVGIYARWSNAQRFGTVMPVELFKTTAVSNTLTIANDTVYLNCYYSNDTTITVQNSYGNISNFYVYGIK